jgi:hypothetical protein
MIQLKLLGFYSAADGPLEMVRADVPALVVRSLRMLSVLKTGKANHTKNILSASQWGENAQRRLRGKNCGMSCYHGIVF